MGSRAMDAYGANSAPPPELSALIVDDQLALAELLAERLALDGISCTIATSAAEALRRCRASPFDVAFVDLRLPDMSGIAAAAEMKQLSPPPKVILVTGFATSIEDLDVGTSHLDGVLPKPWRPSELEALLSSLRRTEA